MATLSQSVSAVAPPPPAGSAEKKDKTERHEGFWSDAIRVLGDLNVCVCVRVCVSA